MAVYKVLGGDNKEYGPATAEEIREWIADGRLNGQSLVQVDGQDKWEPLANLGEFFAALHAQARSAAGIAKPPPLPAAEPASPPQLRIAACLSRAFGLLFSERGVVILLSSFIVGFSCMFLQLAPFASPIYWVLKGVFYGGLSIVFLKLIRGEEASPADAFQGFHRSFGQLMLVGIVTTVLTNTAMLFLFFPGVYFGICWAFAIPLVADRGMGFWAAMELSRKTVQRVWWRVFGLLLIAFLPYIAMTIYTELVVGKILSPLLEQILAGKLGMVEAFTRLDTEMKNVVDKAAPLIVGTKTVLFFILPVAFGALMFAYEELFGPRKPDLR